MTGGYRHQEVNCTSSSMVDDGDSVSWELAVQLIHPKGLQETLADLRSEGSAMVSALRAKSAAPYSVIPGKVDSVIHDRRHG
jgi:hypothetical protein